MLNFTKYLLITLLLFYLKLQAFELSNPSILKIDSKYTKKFFIAFVQSILKTNLEYGDYDEIENTDDYSSLYDINIYCDRMLNKFLNIMFGNTDWLLIKYSKLIKDIQSFLTVSTVNNQIKTLVKQKNSRLNISNGSFANFTNEYMDNDDNGCKILKQNPISDVIEKFDNFLKKKFKKTEVYENDILNFCKDYIRIVDFYLNILKLSMINNLDEYIIKDKLKIDFFVLKKNLGYRDDEEFKFLKSSSVGITLIYFLNNINADTHKCLTINDHIKEFKTDIIQLKFKFLKTFTTKYYIDTKSFCLFNEELEMTLISKIKTYEIKAGCTDVTFKCLHKFLCSCFFEKLIEYPYLRFINLYYSKNYLTKKFMKKIKLLNIFDSKNEDICNVAWLAQFLTSTLTDDLIV